MDVLWSIGLQSRRGMVFGGDPDMEGIARLAEKYGLRDAVIFGKDHCGFCFHPTEIGYPLKNLTHDLTGELASALHRHGIRVIVYVCFGLDGESGRKHPEWLREKKPGVPEEVTKDSWAYLCPFTGYRKEYLMPVVMEILTRYPVDGFFFDTMSATDYCACRTCRSAFRKETGLELPLKENPEDPAWDVYGPWQYERAQKCLQEVRREIEEKRPGTQVLFNHEGQAWNSTVFPDLLRCKLSADPTSCYPQISIAANYGASFSVTGEVFIEHYARGWGDRNECTDLTLQHKAASIFAHRQDFRIGDRLQPEWRAARGSEHVLSVVTKTRDCFARALPDSLNRDPDDLFLVPESYAAGFRQRGFRKSPNPAETILPGGYKLLTDCGRNFLLVTEATLSRFLTPRRNLILSGCGYLRNETSRLIETFIRQGGRVLMTEKVPLTDEAQPVPWSGIRQIRYRTSGTLSAVYLPDLGTCRRPRDGEYPLLQSRMAEMIPAGAKTVLRAYPQVCRELFRDAELPYYLSSDSREMEEPLLTEFRLGKGRVYFLNCAFLTDYLRSPLSTYKKWMENLLRKLFPGTSHQLFSPGGEVELVSYRAEGKSVHVLLNHGGRKYGTAYPYSEQILSPLPPFPVTLKLPAEGYPVVRIDGKKAAYRRSGKYLLIPVVMDTLWKFVTVTEKA